jgi:hypothetical protein
MTKTLIIVAVVVAVAFGGWQLFEYWEKVQDEKQADARNAAAHTITNPQSLPGMPPTYENSLQAAQQQGSAALGNWLKVWGPGVQDPRKAWIQLDYVLLISRENPQEAKRIFNEVRDRTPPSSPVWPRVHELEKSFQ